jgi:D-alanyl-lipoteichoic acid acyltransferase DltB (MBOAT superfamily)
MDAPLLAPTPADFWRRYNRPAQQFFHEDIFKPCGGRRAPIRATLATFAFSALAHEYVFGVILGRVQGYQTVFFLVQGLGVLVTMAWNPKGWRRWVACALTNVFNVTTSVFFFASVNGIAPFYSQPLPAWLAGW